MFLSSCLLIKPRGVTPADETINSLEQNMEYLNVSFPYVQNAQINTQPIQTKLVTLKQAH
jgi:hypothetical protein